MTKKKSRRVEPIGKDRRWHMSKRQFGFPGFWSNYNDVAIGFGEPRERFHGDIPEHAWTICFRLWPPRLLVFKHLKRII